MLNKIYCGDCLDVMSLIPSKSVTAIICDLPYGTTHCKWDIIIPLDKLWEHYNRILKSDGIVILFGVEPFSSMVRMSNLKNYKYDIVWEKERLTNIFQVKKRIGMVHENIMLFYSKQPKYYPQMVKRDNLTVGVFSEDKTSKLYRNQTYKYSDDYDKTMKYPTSVIRVNRDTLKKSYHPTQKPVKLLEYLLRSFTDEGDIVLDNTAGGMSLAVACDNLKRNWICIEKDKIFCENGLERVNKNRLSLNISETVIVS